jgi:hypothetical protein
LTTGRGSSALFTSPMGRGQIASQDAIWVRGEATMTGATPHPPLRRDLSLRER